MKIRFKGNEEWGCCLVSPFIFENSEKLNRFFENKIGKSFEEIDVEEAIPVATGIGETKLLLFYRIFPKKRRET